MSLLSSNTDVFFAAKAGPILQPSLTANRLMAMMSVEDLNLLRPHLKPIRFYARDIVQDVQWAPRSVYFLNSGVASRMMRSEMHSIQTQMIGREGMIGLEAIAEDTVSDGQIVMDTDASGWEIAQKDFIPILKSSSTLQALMALYLRYTQAELGFYAGLTSGWHIRARLATLLLMVSDRLGEDTFRLTHDTMAERLGVRRPGVTVSLHELEGERAIHSRRSHVTIRNRDVLKAGSMGAYGRCEAAYERIMMRSV